MTKLVWNGILIPIRYRENIGCERNKSLHAEQADGDITMNTLCIRMFNSIVRTQTEHIAQARKMRLKPPVGGFGIQIEFTPEGRIIDNMMADKTFHLDNNILISSLVLDSKDTTVPTRA